MTQNGQSFNKKNVFEELHICELEMFFVPKWLRQSSPQEEMHKKRVSSLRKSHAGSEPSSASETLKKKQLNYAAYLSAVQE